MSKCKECGNRIAYPTELCKLRVSNKAAECKPIPMFKAKPKPKCRLRK